MDISIILATYKRPEILNKTLKSFCDLIVDDITWELIIVDNACNPETSNLVDRYCEKLPIVFLTESKPGKNNALNTAIKCASGALYAFTDDDIIANPDWLVQFWEGANRWPGHSVFGGRIVADWPGEIPFWGEDHPLNVSLFALHKPFGTEMEYDTAGFLPYGPNMMIRREIFELGYRYNPDVGPTGEKIYKMGSETELLMRLRDDGFTPVYLPNCVVKHQIRSEQLRDIWLKRRNFRIGFYDASSDEHLQRRLFSCARYLWKQLLSLLLKWMLYKVSVNRLAAFEVNCFIYRVRGKIYAQRQYDGAGSDDVIQKWLQCS